MNLYMIAKSNIKKNKSMTFTLVVLIVFAAILLYIGTSVVLEMNSFLDNKNNELNGSDFSVYAPQTYEATVKNIMNDVGGYVQMEEERAVSSSAAFQNLAREDKSQSMGMLILNADEAANISKLNILYEGDEKLPNSIILPYYLKIAKGYRTGDELTITYEGKTHTYIIYGFAEDIMFAIPSNLTCYKCYVFGEAFNKLYEEAESSRYFLVKAVLPEGSDTEQYDNNFAKKLNNTISGSTSQLQALNYDSMKIGVGIFFLILMVVLIIFSIFIILITLTVIRFAVVTYIEGNVKNIGSMEALGYTGRELVFGTVLQFALITLVSTFIGLALAVSSAGIVTNLTSSSIGLVWNSKINLPAFSIDLVIIMVSVIVISYVTAVKIKKITPVMALRNGIDTHNFKKNHFPLVKGSLNVNVLIGLKGFMQNMRQNIMILIIVTLMSFVCIFAFSTDYNFIVDNTALLRMIGMEKSHLLVKYAGEDSLKVFDEINQMDQVNSTTRLSTVYRTLYKGDNEITPAVSVCKDFNLRKINTIVKGRYPIHDNEIAVTGLVLKRLKAELGDVVTFKGNGTKEEYIIVGITQHINNLGKGACITEEGMKRINPDFIPSELLIYLESSDDIASVKKAIENRYHDLQLVVANVEEQFNTILASFNGAITGVCIACIVITLLIILLILYLLIRIKLLKERMRIGIYKALGYTTKQIILQVVCSFFPVCLSGALIGTVMAVYLINPVLAILLSIAGSIQNSHFTITPALAGMTFLAISLYSVLVTALVAGSVRKITPYELFS